MTVSILIFLVEMCKTFTITVNSNSRRKCHVIYQYLPIWLWKDVITLTGRSTHTPIENFMNSYKYSPLWDFGSTVKTYLANLQQKTQSLFILIFFTINMLDKHIQQHVQQKKMEPLQNDIMFFSPSQIHKDTITLSGSIHQFI